MSNLLAQIKDSATLMCTSIDDPTVYPSCFAPGKGDMTYLQWMLHGWGWTLVVALVALVIALAVGLVIGVMRTLPNRAAVLFGEAWSELFRNVPVLVQLFIWAFVLPEIFPTLKSVSYTTLACVGLGLFTFGDVDGSGDAVRLQHDLGVAWHADRIYIADTYNSKIKLLDPATRSVTTVVGGDTLEEPGGLSIGGETLYVADTDHDRIVTVDLATKKAVPLTLSDPDKKLR